jgi:hypothetical protein
MSFHKFGISTITALALLTGITAAPASAQIWIGGSWSNQNYGYGHRNDRDSWDDYRNRNWDDCYNWSRRHGYDRIDRRDGWCDRDGNYHRYSRRGVGFYGWDRGYDWDRDRYRDRDRDDDYARPRHPDRRIGAD